MKKSLQRFWNKTFTLILDDVFEQIRKMCLKLYQLATAKFILAPGLGCQAALKTKEVKLILLTDNDMLLMVAEGIREGICNTIHQFAQSNNK